VEVVTLDAIVEAVGREPYFRDDSVVIYHADCRDILPLIPAGSVDLVLTDPPYGVDYVTSRRSRNHPLAVHIEGDSGLNTVRDVVALISRTLRDDRHAYLFGAPLRIGELTDALRGILDIKNILVWDKGDAGTVGDLGAGYGWNWEPIIYASKGRRALNGPRPRCIYRYDWSGTRDPVHPTVKPMALLQWLILKSSFEAEIILDPFMGSGTTLRAAKDLGRYAIGIEIEERYCEIAAKRMAQSVMAL